MRLISDVDWTELFERVSLVDDVLRRRQRVSRHGFPDPQSLPQRHRGTGARREPHGARRRPRRRPGGAAAGSRPTRTPTWRQTAGAIPAIICSPADAARSRRRSASGRRWSAWLGRLNRSARHRRLCRRHVAIARRGPARHAAARARTRPGSARPGSACSACSGAIPADRPGGRAGQPRRDARLRRHACCPRWNCATACPRICAPIVAVPTLLTTPAAIEEQIERLEVHHLASPEGELHFALLSDWLDAATEHADGDAALLAAAAAGIARLNRRYGPAPGGDRFLLLHRRRVWNAGEARWIGWERKRGKLHELNRLLRGATDTSFLARRTATPPRGARRRPLRHHARRRHPAAARHGAPADRQDGASAQPAALRRRRGPGRGRLCGAAAAGDAVAAGRAARARCSSASSPA